VRQRGRSINVCLAAEQLIVVASPAIVDAACLFLSRFHKLGHDRLGRRPVAHSERRLDCHQSVLVDLRSEVFGGHGGREHAERALGGGIVTLH